MIGIGVTTRNRAQILADTIDRIKRHTPPDTYRLVIVDDASDPPTPDVTFRFDERAGIARAKNKCLELLDGCDHVFLLDDDCGPDSDDWWPPYVDGPELHYAYTFTHWANRKPVGDCDVIFDDGTTRGLTWQRGCAIYLHRAVIDRVGGFDPVFGLGMWEHCDLSRRIHNAGLSTFCFQDVSDSDRLWHSLDRLCQSPRSFNRAERDALMARNTPLAEARKDSSEFVEYREQRNIVLSCLFTGVADTQRNNQALPASPALAEQMTASVSGAATVILHNQLVGAPAGAQLVKVKPKIPVYFQRWLSYTQYLRTHPDIRFVWCVDATDVTMLHEPWEWMTPGRLYIGHEPDTVACPWLIKHHPVIRQFSADTPNRQLLNAGVVGGDRETVTEWCQALTDWYFGHVKDYGVGDMAAVNMIAHSGRWRNRIEYGSHVATVFRANETAGRAWFRHK